MAVTFHIHYEQWLAEYLPSFRILDVDERTTISYSAVRRELKKAGTPIPSNDVWIAALCRQHSLPLLSRDCHFDAVSGITRLDWSLKSLLTPLTTSSLNALTVLAQITW